jgi:chaperone BCS1
MNLDYVESLIVYALVTAGLYALGRALIWAKDAAMYRWTSTLELSSDNFKQWVWLESYIRTTLLKDANHWIATGGNTRPEPGDVPIPMRFAFEGKTIRMRIAPVEPSRMIIRQYNDGSVRRVATLWTRHVDGAFWHRFVQFLKREHQRKTADRIPVLFPHISNGSAWLGRGSMTPKRSMDSLTLDEAIVREALGDLEDFLSPAYKAFCPTKGVTYRRGWLLEGPPGNGKSSFISAVASHLGTEVGIVSLNHKDLDDMSLRRLMEGSDEATDAPRLLVLEDVDCLFDQREGKEGGGGVRVTFSGLLNALDGVGAAENAIVIMTTNHPEKLDPALIRPGRVDRRFLFANPDDARIAAHYLKFFPKETRLSEATLAFVEQCRATAAKEGRACSMAHVQEQVLREVNRVKAWAF